LWDEEGGVIPRKRSDVRVGLKRIGIGISLTAALAGAGWLWLDQWIDETKLPPLAAELSVTVEDRDGLLLRAFTAGDGRWRLPVALEAVDRGYINQLLTYEDKRFFEHHGVDPLAMLRAAGQAAWNGRVVAGGSTLTMQVARLLEEGSTGRWEGKIRQMRVALALERVLSKDDILSLYLTHAPFGGNLEGVRAATLSYFGKEPGRLTPAEAALLVALPQSPERRRPDLNPEFAREARNRVLERVSAAGVIDEGTLQAARMERSPVERLPFPALAPHLAERVVAAQPGQGRYALTLDADLQSTLERLAKSHAMRLDPYLSVAIMVMDHRTGEVLASVGSPDYLDRNRKGFVDMTAALRSPGSTLKPLIYGLAFDDGAAHPETLIEDRPMDFGGYAPQNFDKVFHGTVSIRDALQMSLNLPAVQVLDAVGPAHLVARMRRAGVEPSIPGGTPGLAVGLGGVGLTLEDLVALYGALANGGQSVEPHVLPQAQRGPSRPVLTRKAAWYVTDILREAPVPSSVKPGSVAFKTGTSYGHRDAWAIGYDGAHVIGVWIGRADAAAIPGALGIDIAAPLLFEAFDRVSPTRTPLPAPPRDALVVSNSELPQPLRRFRQTAEEVLADSGPKIAFPPDGAHVELGLGAGDASPLALKLRDGQPPFAWMVNGMPLQTDPHARTTFWLPDGRGFATISVIDASGQSARTTVFLE
jgi:penicillin-binding protein 1C